jgi:hypothetical protein
MAGFKRGDRGARADTPEDCGKARLPVSAASLVVVASLGLAACGGTGRATEEQRRREHPCQFSATSAQCKAQEAAEKKQEEAHHETKALDERARLEAERARLKSESGK